MANKIADAFDCIKMDPRLKESTKQFLSEKRNKKSIVLQRLFVKRAIQAVCAMLLLVIGIGGYSLVQTPVSYVSIDVNPSIELALNRLDRVVSATAYNEEGINILKDLSLKGKRYTDAIDEVINCEAMEPYLTDESELFFTVAADQNHENKIRTEVENYIGKMGRNCEYNSTKDIGVVSQAHKHGLSLGKYYSYLKLCQYDGTITIDDCKHMSMSEIHHLMKKHGQNKTSCPNKKNESTDENHHNQKTPAVTETPQKETASPASVPSVPDTQKEAPVIDVTTPQPQQNSSAVQQEVPAVSNQEVEHHVEETQSCTQQPENDRGSCTFIDANHDGFCDNGDIHSHSGAHVDANQDGFCDYGDHYCMAGSDTDYGGVCDSYQTTHEGSHQYSSAPSENASNNEESDSHHSNKHEGSHH